MSEDLNVNSSINEGVEVKTELGLETPSNIVKNPPLPPPPRG